MRSASFPPAVRPDARLLLLGSLPGQQSLAQRQYYAHPQNQFWRLVGAVIDRDVAALDYPARLDALGAAGIGLWDVIRSATRPGSLDAAIREPEANALPALVATLPRLAAIGFNGATAYTLGARLLAGAGPTLIRLPSSSPAHAAMPFAAKREAWLALRAWL